MGNHAYHNSVTHLLCVRELDAQLHDHAQGDGEQKLLIKWKKKVCQFLSSNAWSVTYSYQKFIYYLILHLPSVFPLMDSNFG
jgi:hypothetical protein